MFPLKTSVFSEVQDTNAKWPMLVTLSGIITFFKLVHEPKAPLFNPVRTLIMKAQYLQSISILSVVRLINKPLILQPFSGTMIS